MLMHAFEIVLLLFTAYLLWEKKLSKIVVRIEDVLDILKGKRDGNV